MRLTTGKYNLWALPSSLHVFAEKPPWNWTFNSDSVTGWGNSRVTHWHSPCNRFIMAHCQTDSMSSRFLWISSMQLDATAYTTQIEELLIVQYVFNVINMAFPLGIKWLSILIRYWLHKENTMTTSNQYTLCTEMYNGTYLRFTWSEFQHVSSLQSNMYFFPNCFTSLFSTELTLK